MLYQLYILWFPCVGWHVLGVDEMLSAFLYNYLFVVLELVKAISDVPVIKCISLVEG